MQRTLAMFPESVDLMHYIVLTCIFWLRPLNNGVSKLNEFLLLLLLSLLLLLLLLCTLYKILFGQPNKEEWDGRGM